MLHVLRRTIIWISFVLLGITVVAQSFDCPAIVESALNSIDTACSEAGRNQACYGNISIETQFQPDMTDVTFADVGDIVDVNSIESMQLSPMDEANGNWGLAMLRLQANIPDTSPGQNVTFLLFGDVEMTDASADYPDADLTPMQAFYLKTGIGDANCAEAPESGVLVQTPEGVTDVVFNVNGVDVAMGSTILFQAQPNEEMRIDALEGSAMMELDGDIHMAVAGTELRIPIDENFKPTGAPPLPESYDEDRISRIPHEHLQRKITPPPPLTDDQLAQAREMLDNGQLPCGMDGLPDCDKLPTDGLREGPMCRQNTNDCTERLAPHEEQGIRPPENMQQCSSEPCTRQTQLDGQPSQLEPTKPPPENAGQPTESRPEGSQLPDRDEPPANNQTRENQLPARDGQSSGGGGNGDGNPPHPGG